MKTNYFLMYVALLLLLIPFSHSKAQDLECGTSEAHQYRLQNDAKYAKKHHQMEEEILAKTRKRNLAKSSNTSPDNTLYTIPVVFHMIHATSSTPGNEANLTATQVNTALQDLNDAFNGTNTESADTRIQFCLANIDPNGNSTTGRTYWANNEYADLCRNTEADLVRAATIWDPTSYMNVWVFEDIWIEDDDGNCIDGIGGSAYLASSHGQPYDGILIEYDNLLYDTTLPHEAGHYLNLYHTFRLDYNGAGEPVYCLNSLCSTTGDRVCDTPVDTSRIRNCSIIHNSCPNDASPNDSCNVFNGDQPDMIENYMDYSNCRDRFTQGQRERMRMALVTYRSSLLCSNGCGNSLEPSFSYVTNNSFVTFISSMSDANSVLWEFGDGSTSTDLTTYHTYADGTYTVCLTAYYNDCSAQKCETVEVCNPPNAGFSYNASTTPYIPFTSFDPNADSYYWDFDHNGAGSTQANPSYIFPYDGAYQVCLTVTNSCGSDEHCSTIFVNNSLEDVAANCKYSIDYFGNYMKVSDYPNWTYYPQNPPLTATEYSIKSQSRTITASENVVYQAGQNICLNTGFETETGASFLAEIEDCSTAKFEQNLSISDETALIEPELKVYPNPFSDLFNIEYKITKESPVYIEIYNSTGHLVKVIVENDVHSPGTYDLKIDGNDLLKGIYLVRIATENAQITKKLIKF